MKEKKDEDKTQRAPNIGRKKPSKKVTLERLGKPSEIDWMKINRSEEEKRCGEEDGQ